MAGKLFIFQVNILMTVAASFNFVFFTFIGCARYHASNLGVPFLRESFHQLPKHTGSLINHHTGNNRLQVENAQYWSVNKFPNCLWNSMVTAKRIALAIGKPFGDDKDGLWRSAKTCPLRSN